MNKTVNRKDAGIISIISSPGGSDELANYVVTPELFVKALEILEDSFKTHPNRADICQISNDIMDLLFINDEYSEGVIKHDLMMSWGFYNVSYFNNYNIIGMIPIEVY